MNEQTITMIILKSGFKINTENADAIDIVLRKENYMDIVYDGETPKEIKKEMYRTYIRIANNGEVFEIKEEEVAAFRYKENNGIII